MAEFYSENRRARFDYQILDTLEAGIALTGVEVKSVRAGKANIAGSFAAVRGGELFLLGADIPPYQPANTPAGYDPTRARKLLARAQEIKMLAGKLKTERLTIVPLKMYNQHGLIKVELALARPKQKADRREAIKKREVTREMKRALRE